MRAFLIIVGLTLLIMAGAAFLGLGVGDQQVDTLDATAAVIIGLVVASWYSAWTLSRATARPTARDLAQLRERRDVALRDAAVATIGAVIGLNTLFRPAPGAPGFLPSGVPLILLAIALALVAIVPLRWSYLYLRDRLF